MKYRKTILKEAGVLLIGALLIFSSVAVMATTSEKTLLIKTDMKMKSPKTNTGYLSSGNVLWDNWNEDYSGGIAAQHEPLGTPDRFDAFPADDFMFDENTDIYRVYWGASYFNCNYVEGPKDYHFDWNITFFEDDSTGNNPGDVYAGPFILHDADIGRSWEVVNETGIDGGLYGFGLNGWLPDPVTFNADTKYWITIYGINEMFPQTGLARHTESLGGILLHEAKFKSDYLGFPEWTNISEVSGEESSDLNFALLGPEPDYEVTLSKGLGVTATITHQGLLDTTNVTATFTATGGFVLGSRTKTVTVGDLGIGDTETAKAIFIGIGNMAIDVEVTCFWGMTGYADTSGFLLFFLVL